MVLPTATRYATLPTALLGRFPGLVGWIGGDGDEVFKGGRGGSRGGVPAYPYDPFPAGKKISKREGRGFAALTAGAYQKKKGAPDRLCPAPVLGAGPNHK